MPSSSKYACIQHPFITAATETACPVCENELTERAKIRSFDVRYRSPMRVGLSLLGIAVLLSALFVLNMGRFRSSLYEWPGEFASTVLEWGLATTAILLAMPLFRGHAINKDAYSHRWAWLLLGVAVGAAYLFSIAPTFFPDQISDTLRGPKGGIVVLYKTLTLFLFCAMLIRWIELYLIKSMQWQQEQRGELNAWWAPQRAIFGLTILAFSAAVFVFFSVSKEFGPLLGISAALCALVIVNTYAMTLATRLPAKFASAKALKSGVALMSSDLMLDTATLSDALRARHPRDMTVIKETTEQLPHLMRLSRAAVSTAKQNWILIALGNLVLLALASGLLQQWLPIAITPSKAIAANFAIAILVTVSSLRVFLVR